MSRRTIAVFLSKLETFDAPDMMLEQYATDSEVAANLLWDAHMRGDIEGRRIVDLGAGTGILGIGAAILGAKVVMVEKDVSALKTLNRNLESIETETRKNITIVKGDVKEYHEKADVVIMNPPFGTKERHADRVFLSAATRIAPIIYTMHKSSTKSFIEAFTKDAHYEITWEQEISYPLPKTMKHHKKKRERIDVTLYRISKS